MRICYLLRSLNVACHQHVINSLEAQGAKVHVEIVKSYPQFSRPNVFENIRSPEYLSYLKAMKFDFVINTMHASAIRAFRRQVKPRYSYIDIEHDLFTGKPERVPGSTVFACQEKHVSWCKNNKVPFVRCKWPKLEAKAPASDLTLDSFETPILIGSYLFNNRVKDEEDFDLYGFESLWYKKYQIGDLCPKNLKPLPNEFCEPIGARTCLKVSDIILTMHSSCFVEALIEGVIPILIPGQIVMQNNIDPLFSEITLKKREGMAGFTAITTRNLPQKVISLKSEEVYDSVLCKMRDEWLCEEYEKLPHFSEALLNFINEWKE